MTDTNLLDIAERRGPFAVVYVDASHDTADAARQWDLRTRSVREKLTAAGASAGMLRQFDRAVREGPPGRGRVGRLLVLDDEAVHADEYLPDPPAREVVRVSPLPYLIPLLRQHASLIPHVVAVVDRVGCDLRTVDEHGAATERVVEEHPYPVHKTGGGAWSHRSMQKRVEETTRRTIGELAGEVAAAADTVHAEVIVVAGEVAARSALHEALPGSGPTIVEIEAGSRAAGSNQDELAAAVDEVIAAEVHRHEDEVLTRLSVELGRDEGLAVVGLGPTTAALRTANVERLLIDPDRLGDRTVQVGPDRAQVIAETGTPASWSGNTAHRQTCRADEALPVAALLMGAEVSTVAGGLPSEDGVAALVRHR
ncbi:Vms1/Ankzf1 family peptidyl-tRNA hydrolase [Nocardia neocaledoniensis]|uniref:Rv2629 family ribosome hibernation factor n=1 Tax=Nocardia neocaledoniensis TaxID=236511 RepID=UPI0024557562|nr:Vms1/Ankzf1 family peptidyl-tRNA hydrolase [Nocardia neocaledoniensis]